MAGWHPKLSLPSSRMEIMGCRQSSDLRHWGRGGGGDRSRKLEWDQLMPMGKVTQDGALSASKLHQS